MYSNQVQSGLWPDVNTEYAWKKNTPSAVVGHQTSPGQRCRSLFGSLKIKSLSRSHISATEATANFSRLDTVVRLSPTPPPHPLGCRLFTFIRLPSHAFFTSPLRREEGSGGGAPSPGCPFVSHPSIVTIFYLHHHAASFLLWGDWCVRADRDALYLSNRVPGEDRCVMLCRMTDSDA